MVKQADAQTIVQAAYANTSRNSNKSPKPLSCSFECQNSKEAKDCVICQELFTNGQPLVRLPDCLHVFHQSCAMQWLTRHNTCPYCRRELPTDDADYEAQRRRTQQTHAGSQSTATREAPTGDEFYG